MAKDWAQCTLPLRLRQEIQEMLWRTGTGCALMTIRQTLKRRFGFDDFRQAQAEVVAAIVNGRSAAPKAAKKQAKSCAA